VILAVSFAAIGRNIRSSSREWGVLKRTPHLKTLSERGTAMAELTAELVERFDTFYENHKMQDEEHLRMMFESASVNAEIILVSFIESEFGGES